MNNINKIINKTNYLLNLTPNLLNKESLSSLGITFGENIDVIQLKKSIIATKK